jgi:hypothetical protein
MSDIISCRYLGNTGDTGICNNKIEHICIPRSRVKYDAEKRCRHNIKDEQGNDFIYRCKDHAGSCCENGDLIKEEGLEFEALVLMVNLEKLI